MVSWKRGGELMCGRGIGSVIAGARVIWLGRAAEEAFYFMSGVVFAVLLER